MNPLDTVHVLAVEIGPRASASENECRAADWTEQALRGMGCAVKREPFRAVASFSYAYGILFASYVIAAALYPLTAAGAALLCLLALVLFALEASNIETLTRVLPQGHSQNITGVLGPRSAVKRRLVLTAHLDSARSAILWHPRLVPYFRSIFLLIAVSMLTETVLYGAGWITGASWIWPVSLVPAVVLAIAVCIFIARETRYAHTHGANDNASGVAVMLATAAELAREPLAETEVWVVATGCEESGSGGMLRFIKAHPFDRQNTFWLNFDNIGAGRVSYVTGEGILFTLHADKQLVELAAAVARENPALGAQPIVYKTLPTDNTATLGKGLRGMSLMAFDAHQLLPHWHWKTDTIDNVDPGTLRCATAFATKLARKLEQR